jgi:choline kinase
MKALILAAGTGSRLKPYTDNTPKTLVKLHGEPLLEHQLKRLNKVGCSDIGIVTGYLSEQFSKYKLTTFINHEYATTNMLYSLFQAKEFLSGNEDVLICYGDIIYSENVIKKLIATDKPIVVSADTNWYQLWAKRMEEPLDDAESFIYNKDHKVLELGKKINDVSRAMAQYIGLINVSATQINSFINLFESLPSTETKYM